MKLAIETVCQKYIHGYAMILRQTKFIPIFPSTNTSFPVLSLVVSSVWNESVAVQFVTLDLIERVQFVGIGVLVRRTQILCLVETNQIRRHFLRLVFQGTVVLSYLLILFHLMVVHRDLCVAI